MKSKFELREEAEERTKQVIMDMGGLSEEGFLNRMRNDPYFRSGFNVLVQLFIQANFE